MGPCPLPPNGCAVTVSESEKDARTLLLRRSTSFLIARATSSPASACDTKRPRFGSYWQWATPAQRQDCEWKRIARFSTLNQTNRVSRSCLCLTRYCASSGFLRVPVLQRFPLEVRFADEA
jgi:hypothetical protein